jgi:hypothetical protein
VSEEFIIDKDNQEAFEIFANLHPVEAFDLNREKFLEYAKKRVPGVTDDIIIKLIDEERNEHVD